MNLRSTLQDYFKLQRDIYREFGYIEDWKVYPLDDQTDCFWFVHEDQVVFHDEYIDQDTLNGSLYYREEIATDIHLDKSIWECENYTMVLIDTRTDGNVFLTIFDNKKKIDPSNLRVD